jgi:hypothetical protein
MLRINLISMYFLSETSCHGVPLPTGQAGLWLNFRTPHFATKSLRHKEITKCVETSVNNFLCMRKKRVTYLNEIALRRSNLV